MEEELTSEARELLEQKHVELVKIIESFEKLEHSEEWATLKELVFDKSVKAIERQILNVALAPEINTSKLYKLQGEYAWAKQYNDVGRFTETLKKQLIEINKRIK